MSIVLPLWLFVSQWVLLFALGVLIVLAYRQIGYMVHLTDSKTESVGLSIGEEAQAFDYLLAGQNGSVQSRFKPQEQWSFLLFADPGCVSCQEVLPILERLVTTRGKTFYILVVTSANPIQIDVSDAFRETSLNVGLVNYDVPSKLYRTRVTPFAYVVDTQGKIRDKGVVVGESDLRKMLYGVHRNIVPLESLTSK